MTKDITEIFKKFPEKNLIVIGDIIVDQYITGEAIGKSTESPTIVLKEEQDESYLGGAGIVARHLKTLGANVTLIGGIGDDIAGGYVRRILTGDGIKDEIVCTMNKRTTLKRRFIAEGYKLLRTSILDDEFISYDVEKMFIESIKKCIKEKKVDGIIVSDFNYGIITPNVLKEIKRIAKKNHIKLFGDTQSSSQIGDFKQFIGYNLITPNLKEAHIALSEEHKTPEKTAFKIMNITKSENVFLTLGKDGVILLNKLNGVVKLPAFHNNRIDTMGCGDSFLAMASLALCSGADFKEAGFLGSCMASVKLQTIGNVPIGITEVKKTIRRYKKWLN